MHARMVASSMNGWSIHHAAGRVLSLLFLCLPHSHVLSLYPWTIILQNSAMLIDDWVIGTGRGVSMTQWCGFMAHTWYNSDHAWHGVAVDSWKPAYQWCSLITDQQPWARPMLDWKLSSSNIQAIKVGVNSDVEISSVLTLQMSMLAAQRGCGLAWPQRCGEC